MRIDFERIGRTHDVPALILPPETSPDVVAEAVHRHARKYLASSWYEVAYDSDELKGSIEAGRFGRFTVTLDA